MAKRKAGVNDIIYELDNSDIEISSDDEGKEAKIGRFVSQGSKETLKYNKKHNEAVNDIPEEIPETTPQIQNGGKTISDTTLIKTNPIGTKQLNNIDNNNLNKELSEGRSSQCSNTMLFNEDIDSPTADSDLGVVGCENKTPLVTVHFKDMKLAYIYKKQVKEFLINLLKSKGTSNISEVDTDNEIDIWPEDIVDDSSNDEEIVDHDDNLFFLDTDPCENPHIDIPTYSKASQIISNVPDKEENSPSTQRRKLTCFNCDGEHPLRECPLPRDNNKIAEKRKNIVKVGRYHVEDEQKYGHLMPGRISAELRSALGLKRYELPLHIYKMRLLGYPPGWLEDARISHSGIRLFDASGSAILDPEEEEGELNEPGSKDKFDIKKILDFPGFNVPASSRYVEEGHLFGYPHRSEFDSKMFMLQALAPNAMKAYKRKKLMLFPANNSANADGPMEMELDSGDEIPEFPSMPPLPDEAPPPCLPPPPPPPEEILSEKNTSTPNKKHNDSNENSKIDNEEDDVEIIEKFNITNIPVPGDDFIIIDEDYSVENTSVDSPTLAELEEKKRQLLNALKDGGDSELSQTADTNEDTTDLEEIEALLDDAERKQREKDRLNDQNNDNNDSSVTEDKNNTNNEVIDKSSVDEVKLDELQNNIDNIKTDLIDTEPTIDDKNEPVVETVTKQNETTSNLKSGNVKTTLYGTPVINVASPFLKLPSEDKFSKDICDVINFENLPNSIGKYKQISQLLRKVKCEVDRIQDS